MSYISKVSANGDIYDTRGGQVNSDWNSFDISEILNKLTLNTVAKLFDICNRER